MKQTQTALKVLDDKGRLVIPKDLRDFTSFQSGDVIKITASPQEITLRKVGVVDHVTSDTKDIESSIQNAFNVLPPYRQIAIVKQAIEILERNQTND
ncbi:hypothetical protein PT089_02780 [Erysipelothrix rhusiopathiae]|nr:hypothetical protein [Erysipelothrix rhusiopathiae]